MNPSAIALLVFLGIASTLGAVVLAWRDLRAARRAAAQAKAPLRLQRRPRAPQSEGNGPVATFDRWFYRLVRQSGLAWEASAAALLLVLFGLIVGSVLFVWREELFPAVVGACAAAPLPLGYFLYHRWRRVKKLQDQFPPALEILARSVRAGETLDQAFAQLGRNLPQPLASEFRQCALQLEMGLGMPAVMRSLVDRLELYDVQIFATTLTVHRQAGGNVAALLDRLAHVVRDRLSYRRQLRVMTAGGRISAGLVSAIAPALFLFFFFFRPEYIEALLLSPLGQAMLILAVFLEITGLIWTARLLRPAY